MKIKIKIFNPMSSLLEEEEISLQEFCKRRLRTFGHITRRLNRRTAPLPIPASQIRKNHLTRLLKNVYDQKRI